MPRLSKEVMEQRKEILKGFFKGHKEFKTEKEAVKAGQDFIKGETGMGASPDVVKAAWNDNAEVPAVEPVVVPEVAHCTNACSKCGDICDVVFAHGLCSTCRLVPTETKHESSSDEIRTLKARIKVLEEECLTYRATVGTLMKNAGKIYQPGQVNIINIESDMPQERVNAVVETLKEGAK